MNIVIALAQGFWNRLMGWVAAGSRGGPARVQELALSYPTSTALSVTEAATLIDMGKSAAAASAKWYEGITWNLLRIPRVPGPELPNINGGEPGPFNFGLVLTGQDDPSTTMPVVFSGPAETQIDRVIDALLAFCAQESGKYEHLCESVPDIVRNWKFGRKDMIIPMWLYERLEL